MYHVATIWMVQLWTFSVGDQTIEASGVLFSLMFSSGFSKVSCITGATEWSRGIVLCRRREMGILGMKEKNLKQFSLKIFPEIEYKMTDLNMARYLSHLSNYSENVNVMTAHH